MDPVTLGLILKAAGAVFTTGMGVAQTVKQRKLQKQAQKDASIAMLEARKDLDKNVYEALGIPKEVYDLQREAIFTTGAAYLQAAQEGSQRGVGAVTGQGLQAAQAGQAQVSAVQAAQIYELDKMIAAEEAKKDQLEMGLNVGEAIGAQKDARDAAQAAEIGKETMAKGIMSGIDVAVQAAPLISGDKDERKAFKELMNRKASEGMSDEDFISKLASALNLKKEEGEDDSTFSARVQSAAMDKDADALSKLTEFLFNPPPPPTQAIPQIGIPTSVAPLSLDPFALDATFGTSMNLSTGGKFGGVVFNPITGQYEYSFTN
jgi:hypothetical protein